MHNRSTRSRSVAQTTQTTQTTQTMQMTQMTQMTQTAIGTKAMLRRGVRQHVSRGLAASAVWLFAALVGATPALAHVFPKHQDPGAGSAVSAPKEIRIQFDGDLEPAFSKLTVTDSAGKEVESEKSVVDAQHHDVISVGLPNLPAGKYAVHWVAVASDGHRTHGDYTFEVK